MLPNVLVAAICCFGRMAAFNSNKEDTFFFFSSGEGNNPVERKFKRNQITAERLAMMFEVSFKYAHSVELAY